MQRAQLRTTHDLVGLAQEGDGRALNELLVRYLPRILRVVRLKRGPFLGRRLDDHDLTQEVLIRVWRSLGQYDPTQTASFLLWVTRVAQNALRDQARRQRAAKRYPGAVISMETERERGVPEFAIHPVVTTTPSRLIGQLEDHEILDGAVATLGSDVQELLILRYYFDLPLDDVGRHLGLGAEAARSRIRRALARLRDALEEHGVVDAHRPERLLRLSF